MGLYGVLAHLALGALRESEYVDADQAKRVWVIFTDKSDVWYLRYGLRRGFRHALLAYINEDGKWVVVDSRINTLDITTYTEWTVEHDLPAYMADEECTVIEAFLREPDKKHAPVMPMTCVETIKRILGIHSWLIVTPYQLYKYLRREYRERLA